MNFQGDRKLRAPTVNEIIDQHPLSRFQIIIMVLCGMVIVLDGFDTQSIGFLAPSMADSLHIPIKTFGPVFGAALFGLMISSMAAGPIADRWGRKWPIVSCALLFGTFAILTAQATTFRELIAFRFLTGLGLGGGLSNAVALLSEYAPRRLLAVLVGILYCGMPTGALLGGLVSSVMLPRWGWQSVFYAGGILPFALALLLIAILPESVRYLEISGADQRKISKILARIAPEFSDAPVSRTTHEDRRRKSPVKHLFTEGRAAGTILLWIPYFMNLLILYFTVSWLPALLRQTGLPVSAGITAIIVFSVGGIVGTILEGYLMNWWTAGGVLLTQFLLTTLLIASLAYSISFAVTIAITFVLGIVVQGSQGGLGVIAATYYPTSIRSTGIGWALGVGRVGSIVGPLLGGWMLTLNWGPRQILLAGAVPAVCSAAAILLNMWFQKNSPANPEEAEIIEEQPASPAS
ncbi:MAG TPA: MFS transporter [Candidatus Dormibacteraeota bacterium]|nr:MFS transporter [Candidatus Dormibacteraeota bacterium]